MLSLSEANKQLQAKGKAMAKQLGEFDIELTMVDELSGETVKRVIDITNALVDNGTARVLGDRESQRRRLNNWIEERGNKQHDTILRLVDWSIG